MIHLTDHTINKVQFNKVTADLDQIQNAKFTLRRVHTEDKVEGRIVPVNQLIVRATNETVTKLKCGLRSNFTYCVIKTAKMTN